MTALPEAERTVERFKATFAYVGDALLRQHTPPRQPTRGQLSFGRLRRSRTKSWPWFPRYDSPPPGLHDRRRTALIRQALAVTLDVGQLVERTLELADPAEREWLRKDRGVLIQEAQIYVDRAFRPIETGFWARPEELGEPGRPQATER